MLDIFQKWKDKIGALVENKVRRVQLEFIERTSVILSYIIFAIILIVIGFGAILFLGLGLAEWFTTLLDSRVGGFMMAAGCYVILALIMFAIRKRVLGSMLNTFIGLLTERKDDDDDEEDDKNTESGKA